MEAFILGMAAIFIYWYLGNTNGNQLLIIRKYSSFFMGVIFILGSIFIEFFKIEAWFLLVIFPVSVVLTWYLYKYNKRKGRT